MAHLTETIAALKKGVKNMTVDGAVKSIEMWEKELRTVDGASMIITDLGKLKTALKADKQDSKVLKDLMGKLATETKKVSSKAGAKEDQLKDLGMALQEAA